MLPPSPPALACCRQEPAMAVSNVSLSSQPNALMRREVWPPAFGKESISRLQLMPTRSLPLRVAVVGNHLPRQCGIATFTTDLCDAIAARSEERRVGEEGRSR